METATLDEALRLHHALRDRRWPGIEELVPGARSVLIIGSELEALARELPRWTLAPLEERDSASLTIPVTYNGEDLVEVARLSGLAPREVIALHTASALRVAFLGFAPGFAYLSGLPEVLNIPRRSKPRVRVSAGSVGLAGGFTAVYPRASPGGWHLIGHTDMNLWDLAGDPPSPLVAGARVRFVETG